MTQHNNASQVRVLKYDYTTRDPYKREANYRFTCPECDTSVYRKQATGTIRRVVENPNRGQCPDCGHDGLIVHQLVKQPV